MQQLLLWFRDKGVEREYRVDTAVIQRDQARAALLVGVFLYGLHGGMDVWLAGEHPLYFWGVRLLVMVVGLSALAWTFHPSFPRLGQRILVVAALTAGLGVVFMLAGLSGASFWEYLSGLMLVMIWTFLFVGLSFAAALLANLIIVAGFNGLFFLGPHTLEAVIFRYNFYLGSTLLVCGFSAYVLERQRRLLYLRHRELEMERNRHRDLAMWDHLTDLPNRYQMEQRLDQAIARARRYGRAGAGLFIDLDHFKPVNDTHGHEAGDRVLRQVARRLKTCVRESDTVARMGGDEFFVLLEDLPGPERIREVALRIIASLSEPVPIDDLHPQGPVCALGASIGVCEFPDMAATPAEVIDYADRAMYEVKRSGRNGYSFHRPAGPGPVIHHGEGTETGITS